MALKRAKGKAITSAAVTLPFPRKKSEKPEALSIREGFGISRGQFHRLSGFSERALANWEKGVQEPDEATLRRLRELGRLRLALSGVMRPEAIPEWLMTPNAAFGGFKPVEVVERGEIDRLWRMVFELSAGVPA